MVLGGLALVTALLGSHMSRGTNWVPLGFVLASWTAFGAMMSWTFYAALEPFASCFETRLPRRLRRSSVFPISLTISILRYRLFDIDVIIRRTLIYGLVTGLLTLIFFGGVLLIQAIFRVVTGQESQLAVVASTLVIVALFNPLRLRIQAAIDRRFYRRKYDTEQVLAAFARTARDEVDLERLTITLQQVVRETMEPTSVSLWLKPGEEIRKT
jgi:hypothetical protein